MTNKKEVTVDTNVNDEEVNDTEKMKLENQRFRTKMKYTWSKKVVETLRTIAQVAVLLFIMYGSFYIGTIYSEMMNKEVIIERQEINNIGETSVSINERNELMILDRNTGNYQIYQDSVGISIFWLYARQLHEELK